ncbi:hypothetical protein [Inquilinus limosus]|uniref:hypothetical protein n=1 Tax=Inquilinus limosus TaxID=171674 RepID=UPI0003F84959|nr:hypothetical protein [Inquilinus limosus]
MARRFRAWTLVGWLLFVNVLEDRRLRLSPKKIGEWVILALVIYSVLSGRDNVLISLLSLITG